MSERAPVFRVLRRARAELAAVRHGLSLGGAAADPASAVALFAVGLAQACPTDWASRALKAGGVSHLRVRPRRFAGVELNLNADDRGHLAVVDEFLAAPPAYDLSMVEFVPDTVIDCGAHIGLFTLLARRRFPSAAIVAFEPNPDNITWLQRNLDRNGVRGVDVVAGAVSTSAGTASFRLTPSHSEAGRVTHGPPDAGARRDSIDVTIVDLPAFVRDRRPRALLLKIDIEGEEETLIPSLVPILPADCAIFFETHRGADSWDAIRGALEAAGFAVRELRRRDVFADGLAVRSAAPG